MSTQTKHTPGPWIRRRDVDNSPDTHVLAEDGCLIASVNAFVSFNPATQDSEEMKANARLIAAAPELLAALRMASVLLWKNSKALRHPNPQDIDEAFEAMRAAIAKATGQS